MTNDNTLYIPWQYMRLTSTWHDLYLPGRFKQDPISLLSNVCSTGIMLRYNHTTCMYRTRSRLWTSLLLKNGPDIETIHSTGDFCRQPFIWKAYPNQVVCKNLHARINGEGVFLKTSPCIYGYKISKWSNKVEWGEAKFLIVNMILR